MTPITGGAQTKPKVSGVLIKVPLKTRHYKRAVASTSWIDPSVKDGPCGLELFPIVEYDQGAPVCTPQKITLQDVMYKEFCRFSNVLVGNVSVRNGEIIDASFDAVRSSIFMRPSFMATTPQEMVPANPPSVEWPGPIIEGGAAIFRQTVGARTKAPEEILGTDKLVSFPPIWSTVELKVFANGTCTGRIIRHSIFPSCSFFVSAPNSPADENFEFLTLTGVYNGVPQYDNWCTTGWGPLAHLTPDIIGGNPWGMQGPSISMNDVCPSKAW